MSKFKVGDKVVCVDPLTYSDHLKKGEIYTVTGVSYNLVYLDRVAGSYFEKRFELYQEPRFKVGDKVTYNSNLKSASYYDTKVHTVLEVKAKEYPYHSNYLIKVDGDDGWSSESHFDKYDEDMYSTCSNPFEPPEAINPNHYTRFAIQPLTYIRANGLNFTRGNIVKYATRAGFKDGSEDIEDMEKIIRYAQAEIEAIKRERDVANGLADVYEVWNKAI